MEQVDVAAEENTIKLIYKKGHRYVKIVDFVAVSQLIKQHQVTGRVPRSIDLTDYFDSTITIFADYIEKGEVKTLILTADTSTEHLIQAVLVAGTSNITKETENALHYLASWSFVEMANLPDFQRIPYHQPPLCLTFIDLRKAFDPLETEAVEALRTLGIPTQYIRLVVADAALLWLVGQPHPAVYAPGVFAMIRSAYLSKVDRQLIVERIATLQMPESVARFARVSMESRHNARICLEGTHINRHLVRCGIPDPENRPKETSLSLSRPRDGIRWSDKTRKTTPDREGVGKSQGMVMSEAKAGTATVALTPTRAERADAATRVPRARGTRRNHRRNAIESTREEAEEAGLRRNL
ncbi:unnamed protein product [Heligmosomoides polygyrus]|uniref:Reverse transcriptase domain-containing protein n=1 Tax=Heligmosomoides polygyrus TaxID=6339 RepID=A0A3P8FXK2_HELPZ|nr:unnamed protein product [Heligmosomoides polygyrus]